MRVCVDLRAKFFHFLLTLSLSFFFFFLIPTSYLLLSVCRSAKISEIGDALGRNYDRFVAANSDVIMTVALTHVDKYDSV